MAETTPGQEFAARYHCSSPWEAVERGFCTHDDWNAFWNAQGNESDTPTAGAQPKHRKLPVRVLELAASHKIVLEIIQAKPGVRPRDLLTNTLHSAENLNAILNSLERKQLIRRERISGIQGTKLFVMEGAT
jgi:hypothetical protein